MSIYDDWMFDGKDFVRRPPPYEGPPIEAEMVGAVVPFTDAQLEDSAQIKNWVSDLLRDFGKPPVQGPVSYDDEVAAAKVRIAEAKAALRSAKEELEDAKLGVLERKEDVREAKRLLKQFKEANRG